jgi:hypothetical protein
MPKLRSPWDRCLEGLSHPHTGVLRPITFEHDVVVDRDDVVLVHLEHPLVRMAQRLLRAEVWSPTGRGKLHRVTARRIPAGPNDGVAVLAHARLVVIGGGHQALHEELIAAGGILKGGRFERCNVTTVQELLDQASDEAAPNAVHAELRAMWSTAAQPVRSALEARVRERTRTLESRMSARAEEDVARITAVLEQLAETIRSELTSAAEKKKLQQGEFDFSREEAEQWDRNYDELERRLAAIPDEIEAEARRIRSTYSDPRPLLFPVSVTWLVPDLPAE